MIDALVNGIFVGIGFCVGFFLVIIFTGIIIYKAINNKERVYDTDKLYTAFNLYYDEQVSFENYNKLNEVNYIKQKLKEGLIPEEVFTYNIQRKNEIALKSSEDDSQIIKVIEKYIVLGKKPM